MKNQLFFFILLIICISCAPTKEITLKEREFINSEANTMLDNWHKAASDADFDKYFSKMDSISVFIGTDASENWNKKTFQDFSKPFFDKGKAWDFKTLQRNIYISKTGDFVWFDELLNTWMGTCRGSGVLEKKENNWVIKQYVLSIAIPNNAVQSVIKAKKKSDSLFINKFIK
jgi:hypothetical protein